MKYLLIVLIALVSAHVVAQSCNASFTFDDTYLTIQFTDLSTSDAGDPITSWFWDFDDGSTSTQQNPLHTFPDVDKYDVELSITTQNGCTSTIYIDGEVLFQSTGCE